MYDLTINDIIFCSCLLALVPLLVNHYLSASNFSSRYRNIAILGGLIWLSLGLGINDLLITSLGTYRADDLWHSVMGVELAERMMSGDWDFVRNYGITGNMAFHVWLGSLYFLTGVGKTSGETFNSLLGFWGSLMLTRHLARALPSSILVPDSMFFVTFLPSAIFWTSTLIKEGLMFWGICLFLTSIIPSGRRDPFKFSFMGLIGLTVGMIFRPYVMVVWVVSMAVLSTYRSGKVLVSAFMIAAAMLCVVFFSQQINSDDVGEANQFAQMYSASIRSYGQEDDSTITGPQIFFVSGAITLFFRPFLWNLRAVRVAITSIEIWTISGLIILGWRRATTADRGLMLSRPDVMVCILVCLAYCVLFTFYANEGQAVRQRLQAMPALLTLAYVPYLLRYSRKVERKRMRMGGPVRVR